MRNLYENAGCDAKINAQHSLRENELTYNFETICAEMGGNLCHINKSSVENKGRTNKKSDTFS